MTTSAEETCDHLINVWIARHGYPITIQSDNDKAFVGELTEELMKRFASGTGPLDHLSPTKEWPN